MSDAEHAVYYPADSGSGFVLPPSSSIALAILIPLAIAWIEARASRFAVHRPMSPPFAEPPPDPTALAGHRTPRLQTHHRHRPLLAFPQCLRLRPHRRLLRLRTPHQLPMGPPHPPSWGIFVDAWNTFVYYANFHLPPEPNGFYGYNALQQLVYFSTIFIMAPLSILTGMAMSSALVNRFPRYVRIFGGRQGARSIHLIVLVGFVYFIAAHVTLVAITGFARNMNHIVLGVDNTSPTAWSSASSALAWSFSPGSWLTTSRGISPAACSMCRRR